MTRESWSTFSFTETLNPPEGWRTDAAILSTYSADLVVVVTTLLALTGCDLENRRTGSRVELVKAIEALRGRVRVLAQGGRLVIPRMPRPILKLLDKFVLTVDSDETENSWHPKAAFIRYHDAEDPTDFQWRVWLGSRNLTRALNWEAGMVLGSRSDGKGKRIDGLAAAGESLANRANLATFPADRIGAELAKLTWDCAPGCDVQRVRLFGPGGARGFPSAPPDTQRVFIVSPFLHPKTVRAASKWGNAKTHRTLVSTAMEIQRLFQEDDQVFAGFGDLRIQPLPDLPAEGIDVRDEEEPAVMEAAGAAESEEIPPCGLHAKLFFAGKGSRRQLWLGSANATERGWGGRNYEIVAELAVGREAADGLEDFVAKCDPFNPNMPQPKKNEDEEILEQARKQLSGHWILRQEIRGDELEIIGSSPPPLTDASIELKAAILGGAWGRWPHTADRIQFSGFRRSHRTEFVQIRILRGDKMCGWIQLAPCDPPPDEERDHALIAQYLDPRTFLMWLRSMLADEPAHAGGGDWDADPSIPTHHGGSERQAADGGIMPTVEEILRAWARNASAFAGADEKVTRYLGELERRAEEGGMVADAELLKAFRATWNILAQELR